MLKFYHAPWSRSISVFWLLEELGQPYEIELVDIRAPGGVPESYREIQPNKKVPAVVHDGTVVTERAAICLRNRKVQLEKVARLSRATRIKTSGTLRQGPAEGRDAARRKLSLVAGS
jgi:hypothetical protein